MTAAEARTADIADTGHVPALDGLRGIAILLVLFFHFPAPFGWLRPLASIGWCGVDLFFVLSGFLITGILYRATDKPGYFKNFYIRRSLRIFPLYYGFLALALLVLPRFVNPYWLGLEGYDHRKAEFFLYYSNVAIIFAGWAPRSLGAFWSLAVEEHFYLFWPLFIKNTRKGKLLVWCVGIAILAALGRLALVLLRVPWPAAYYLTTSRVDALVIGSVTAILVRQRPGWPKDSTVAWIAGTIVAILAAIAVWRHGLGFSDWVMRAFGYSLLALLFACLVRQAATTKGRISRALSNPALRAFGKYSYALYVFHMLVLTLCERLLGPRLFPRMGWKGDAPLPLFLLSFTLVSILAYLSWHLYEKHFLALKNRLSERNPGTLHLPPARRAGPVVTA